MVSQRKITTRSYLGSQLKAEMNYTYYTGKNPINYTMVSDTLQ